jgi:tetratricopeptide (TPR) repeat protein
MADLLNEKDQLIALEGLLKENKVAAALELALKLLKEFPDSFQIQFTHAKVLRATGQLPQAAAVLEKLIPAHRGHLNLLLEMAAVSRELKQHSQALDYYNQALFIDPFNKQAKKALAELRENPAAGQPAPGKNPAPRVAYEQEKKKWQADTLPEEEIGKILDDEKWQDDEGREEPITRDSIRMEDEIEILKPSIPGVDEAYVPPETIKVEGPKNLTDPALEESLMPHPDFLPGNGSEDDERVTTDDVADVLTGGGEKSKADTASTRRPPDLSKKPATAAPLEGDEFVTESAARLYLSQGLYEEALFIYEKLQRQKPDEKFARKIEELKSKCQCQKKIQALTAFLQIIQERGG